MIGKIATGEIEDDADTTTPLAMAELVRRITTRDILAPASGQCLLQWMENTQTGALRLRAGLPTD